MESSLEVRTVEFEGPEYWEFLRIRQDELHRPIGLVYTEPMRGAERICLHLVLRCARSDRNTESLWVQPFPEAEGNHAAYSPQDEVVLGGLLLSPWSDRALKMRQVAVASHFRERGGGTALVRAAEDVARKLGYEWIVAHARAKVVPFYEKLGYFAGKTSFEEVGIAHRLVLRRLFV